ncbi:dual specificity protein phosphatase 3 isoform X2 [Megachile rotundata]|uniref:dual specificity protein phosphatase 3 isoform X2 n=1 Tax=Megachile rotundata TaxID=143995 RepID=UPI0006150F62|nr:PREDICTED: dual specificity protein phosphatase 3 isoform X1 [Megachile rotundata]
MMRSTWRDRDRDFQKHLPDGITTQQHLAQALHATRTDNKPIPGFNPNVDHVQYYRAQQGIDCDEVYPGIYIGDAATAKNIEYLKMLGITHLLNAAQGKKFGFVNTDESYYINTTIKYLGLPLADLLTTDISKYFYTAAAFIDEAVSTGGKAFVHCMLGISRSATCVLAYLMIKKGMLAVDAIRTVRKNRNVQPNSGFLYQLAQLDNQLRRQRL